MQDTINRIEKAFHQKNEEIKTLRSLVRGVYSSVSWKITAPLRKLHSILNNSKIQSPDFITSRNFSADDVTDHDVTELLKELQPRSASAQKVVSPPSFPPISSCTVELPVESLERDTMMDFFIFPIIDWEFRFQRPQQIALKLAMAGNRIFYFKTTFNRFTDRVISDHLEIKKLGENVYQVKLATRDPLNIYRDLVHGRQQMTDLLDSISVVKRLFAIRRTVSIIDHPFWWPVARSLQNNLNVYDCMDDHSGFDNNMNITTYEPALIAEADLVAVSSEILFSNVKGLAKNVIQVKNGTDFVHFNELPESDVLRSIGRPIIGYYGAIAEWFDVSLIEACARQYPQYQFVLIGRVTNTDIPRLKEFPNIHLPGEIPYAELPKYVKYFDVCLIPFRLTKLIEATNPVKFYEYLSSGKPVVSVMLPELVPYGELCYLSSSPKEFIENIQVALSEKNKGKARIELAGKNSWSERSNTFIRGITALYPRVSIVVVTFNNLHFTKKCYQSIKKYTRYPNYEIIFVDNHSTDDTPVWLEKVRENDAMVKIILNQENFGFAKANNQGLTLADGEYFVYLNNDTVVTNNWLESLLNHLQNNPSIGLICPATNETGNEACVRIDYHHIDDLQRFAFEYTENKMGLYRRVRTVPLYCALIKTALLLQIGGLNEEYAIGMFEDDELSEQVKKLGYQTVFAEDVFINHFGRASFKKIPKPEYDELFRKNKAIFEKKWGKYVPHIRGWFNTPVEIPES
jgi:O-antigen biosynthesis protein